MDIPFFVISRTRWEDFDFRKEVWKPHARIKIANTRHLARIVSNSCNVMKGVQLRIRSNTVPGSSSGGILEVVSLGLSANVVTAMNGVPNESIVAEQDSDLLPLPHEAEGINSRSIISDDVSGDRIPIVGTHRDDTYTRDLGNSSLLSSQTTELGVCQVTVNAEDLTKFLVSFTAPNGHLLIGIKNEEFAVFKMVHQSLRTDFLLPSYDE